MALVEISVMPIGTPTPSLSPYVAGAVRVLKGDKQIRYELTPMGTVIEGDLDHVLGLVGRMHKSAFALGAVRVVTTVKIDERIDREVTLDNRLDSVQRRLEGTDDV
ncbi:MAG: MTH1187 family thiamine-binding protein [Chloroflexi bacterium]|nr:MTH1187 family thiamine-binding protein [Chloroflexota bacterium]